MNYLNIIMARLRTRSTLIAIAILLIVLNIGRFATNQYLDFHQGLESKQALLDQYRAATKEIDSMRQRVKLLEQQNNKFDSYMFTGDSPEDITSAMQIKIQELLSKASLSPESLRPTNSRSKDKDKIYGEVVISVRLTGSFENFILFLKELYKLNYLFKIDNFTLKPFKKSELKVFLEMKGFYKLDELTGDNPK